MYHLRLFFIFVYLLIFSDATFAEMNASPILTKKVFAQLQNWQEDNHSKALSAFQHSCYEILKRNPKELFSSLPQSGLVSHWQTICRAASKINHFNKRISREFFETWFDPYYISDGHEGLFTGYYLPLIHAHLKPTKRYKFPIYALPNDLIKIDLNLFHPELIGKTIVGQLKGNVLSPYPDRASIEQRRMNKNMPVLAWSDNPIDVYFAHIQGSALVQLANKQIMIGYAGNNGRKYTSIGKILIEMNQLDKQTISMQSIRAWLKQHPKQANTILNQNASYVFFKILRDKQPLGTEKIPLTPERSLAVDNRYIPLGAPIWLNTRIPNNQEQSSTPFRHLLIAQDTGGAIKGVVRGDVYWGAGDKAAFIAGHMNSPGEYWILLPRKGEFR